MKKSDIVLVEELTDYIKTETPISTATKEIDRQDEVAMQKTSGQMRDDADVGLKDLVERRGYNHKRLQEAHRLYMEVYDECARQELDFVRMQAMYAGLLSVPVSPKGK